MEKGVCPGAGCGLSQVQKGDGEQLESFLSHFDLGSNGQSEGLG